MIGKLCVPLLSTRHWARGRFDVKLSTPIDWPLASIKHPSEPMELYGGLWSFRYPLSTSMNIPPASIDFYEAHSNFYQSISSLLALSSPTSSGLVRDSVLGVP